MLPRWARTHALRLFPPKIGRPFPPRIKLRICTDCNHQMGRRYEDRASPLIKPMMQGLARQLTPLQQGDISRWMVKTTLLLSIANRIKNRRDYEPTRQLLLTMLDEDAPPAGTSVRVGRFPAAGEEGAADGNANLADLLPGGPPPRMHFYAVTTLAHFAFEMVMTNSPDALHFIARTEASDRLVRLWPPQIGTAHYPPPHDITAADITAMRQAFTLAMPHGTFVRHAAGDNIEWP